MLQSNTMAQEEVTNTGTGIHHVHTYMRVKNKLSDNGLFLSFSPSSKSNLFAVYNQSGDELEQFEFLEEIEQWLQSEYKNKS